MQQELVDQHHRQQARSGKTSRDRMRGRQRLGDRLAVPAGELFADMLDNLPARGLAFQGLRHHLAELVQQLTAALAARARRGFDDTFDRQVAFPKALRFSDWKTDCPTFYVSCATSPRSPSDPTTLSWPDAFFRPQFFLPSIDR